MTMVRGLLSRLENMSDWLSPIVVKEVRQLVRTREFASSFGASLVAGVAIAFFGAADALAGSGTSGRWTFGSLMTCLAVLGLGVVPLGAFSALRNERLEQTLDLITVTALSPRRVAIGKLMAQAVKLGTLFAAMAPFIAMSFLLGGIDFASILLSLTVLFMWSLWACAACIFLSTLLKSRAMFGLVFGGIGIALLLTLGLARSLFFITRTWGGSLIGVGASGSRPWIVLAIMATVCLATMVNLVLLAENRLSPHGENRIAPLRIGFLMQFLLLAGWVLWYINEPVRVRSNAIEALGVLGGLHLALVAMFAVTDDLTVPRRVLVRTTARLASARRWLLVIFRPGGGSGAVYVLVQMAILLLVAWLLDANWLQLRWLLAICAYILFFTGVPTLAIRFLRQDGASALQIRVVVLLLLMLSLVLPDIVHYLVWQPDKLSLVFSARHLLNPIRTLSNWAAVETQNWFSMPVFLGLTGLSAYVLLIQTGARLNAHRAAADPEGSAAAAGEPGSANVLY